MDGMLAQFERERPRLFALAYRMLGSVSEAEDVLQDAWIRRQRASDEAVGSESAFLTTIVTRLSLDVLRASKNRRENYYGVWLPEPLPTETAPDPAEQNLLQDNISMAFMLMLETLTPVERAVFLLREVLDFSYQDISAVVDKQIDNCRQIERRARTRLAGGEKRFDVDETGHRNLLQQFMQSCQTGDVEALVGMLETEAVLYADGGGKVRAAPLPVAGASRIATVLVNLTRNALPGSRLEWTVLNGAPALLHIVGEKLDSIIAATLNGERISQLFIVRNPDKLGACLKFVDSNKE